MQMRLQNVVSSLREASKSPIAMSLVVAMVIVASGIYFTRESTRSLKKNPTVTVGAPMPGDAEFQALLKRLPQLVATSGVATLSEDERKYFEEYLRNEGDRIGKATMRGMVEGIDKKKFQVRYTKKDLTIVADDSHQALRMYAHAAGVIAEKYAALNVKRPEDIVPEALKSKNRSPLLELGGAATGYRNLSDELRKLPVPQKLGDAHLAVVNGYDVMSRSLIELVSLFDNPALGSAAWQAYTYQSYHMTRGFTVIIQTLHEAGVVFNDKKDPSYNFRWRGI